MGFGYGPDDGPAHWILKYPSAGGRHQSPVDIETELVEYDSRIHEHPLKIDFKTEQDPEAQNNGHSFVVEITEESTVTGGILGKEEYNFEAVPFPLGWHRNIRLMGNIMPQRCVI